MTLYSIPPRVLQTIAWGPTRLLLKFFCHFEVQGTEHIRGLSQAIFAVNHSNELDPIVLTAALNPLGRFAPMYYLASAVANFRDPKFGWRRYIYGNIFFKAWGAYPIQQGLRNYEKSLETHVALLKEGGSLCVFPEGGITRDGKLQVGRGGVSYLAYKTGVAIVPVAINGTFHLDSGSFLRGSSKVVLAFGEPVLWEDLMGSPHNEPSIEDFRGGAQRLMEKIEALLR